jgi:hypothetical protein
MHSLFPKPQASSLLWPQESLLFFAELKNTLRGKNPCFLSVSWSRAGREEIEVFYFPALLAKALMSYLTPDSPVINNVIRCNL